MDDPVINKYRWRLGLILLASVIFLWVASGFMVNAMSVEYSKPVFMTYASTGTFTVYLLPTVIHFIRKARLKRSKKKSQYTEVPNAASSSEGEDEESEEVDSNQDNDKLDTGAFTFRETAILGLEFSLLWFSANLFNNVSYVYTTVASATILSCTSSFFTLILGSIFKVERFTIIKLGALVISVIGVMCIYRADEKDPTTPSNGLLGNIFSLLSAALYGIYTTLVKVKVGDETRINTKLFFGFVGLWNIVLLWPVLVILNYMGWEPFGLPSSSKIWWLLILNSASTLVSDFFWILAMLMTSPLVVTVGLSATIPLSMIGDMALNQRYGSFLYCFGAGLVCFSFFVINQQEEEDETNSLNQVIYDGV